MGPIGLSLFCLAADDPSLGYLLARRPMITRIASKACSWSWWLAVVWLYSALQHFEGMLIRCICYIYVAWPEVGCLSDAGLGCCVLFGRLIGLEPSTNVEFLLELAWLAGY
ncbi:hypothetical protein Nepgr_030059 [Nepenthes gracilis]|uniref:Uncharacterized protein n=1 Tax=Nepenthes gracilis TaxID=150966 RepID=A0AAD3Y669_NEPGR|nr:hypothetical protein Nepgr_030059 [Nepenthes gracilis]